MADSGDTAARPAPATLSDCIKHASTLEEIIRDVTALLDAIGYGGLLDAAPTGSAEYEQHSTAARLVYMAEVRLRDVEKIGTELSGKLSALQRKGR
jgi:hypothetical protein